METSCILEAVRIHIFFAGTFAILLTLFTSCTDHLKVQISGYILMWSLMVTTLELVGRMVQSIFIIFKQDNGYQAFKLHQTLSMVSPTILFCQWLPLRRGTEDL
nr:telomerase Cajal body protein 1 isoform X2 [Ipomoea batatas]